MFGDFVKSMLSFMAMETLTCTLAQHVQPFGRQTKRQRLVFGRIYDSDGRWHHDLVPQLTMHVHATQKTRLTGMCVNPTQRHYSVLLLCHDEFFLVQRLHSIARALLFRNNDMRNHVRIGLGVMFGA